MFKSLKSLFFVEEPSSPASTPLSTDTKTTTEAAPTAPIAAIPRVSAGAHDQRIFDSLQQALESHNQEGFDFLEFKSSLQTLAGIIPDEATRYKSAFATAATLGVTPDKLLQSADFYKGVLEREKENFNNALTQQVDVNVNSQRKEVEQLQALITEKSAEVARLTQEIAAHQEAMTKAQGIIVEAQTKIDETKNNFYSTLDIVLQQIQTDVENIQKYLKS